MSGSKAAGAIAALVLVLCTAAPAFAQPTPPEQGATTPHRRTRIVIHPRSLEPGPNAKRYCRAWLAVENRPSGQVITPQRECWWQ
jgi:hypothetical protein